MTKNQLKKQIRIYLIEAMADFPSDHLLDYHADKFINLFEEAKNAK